MNHPHPSSINTHNSDVHTYRTLPPQNWHSSPCQPSEQTHVPFMHAPPFIQDTLLMHLFAATTWMQQLINTKTLNTTKTSRHFRCDSIVHDFINIWAKNLSIFKFATFFNAYLCCLLMYSCGWQCVACARSCARVSFVCVFVLFFFSSFFLLVVTSISLRIRQNIIHVSFTTFTDFCAHHRISRKMMWNVYRCACVSND